MAEVVDFGSEPNLDTLRYAETISRDVLQQQIKSVDALVNSASILIGFGGILIAILVSSGIPEYTSISELIYIFSIISIIIAIVFAIYGALASKLEYSTDPEELWKWTGESELKITKQVYGNIIESYKSNKTKLKERWEMMYRAYICMVSGVVLIGLYICLEVLWS